MIINATNYLLEAHSDGQQTGEKGGKSGFPPACYQTLLNREI